jgi:ABC-type dipeptide/oligopeptide/nickel transport system permease component
MLLLVPTLLGVVTLVFVVLRVIPGDPAIQLAGDTAQRQDVEAVRRELGLDRPMGVQYLDYLRRVATGDLGVSFRTRSPVSAEIAARLGATLELAGAATVLTAVVGILAGAAAAHRRRGTLDNLLLAGGVFGLSLPSFWVGLVLIWLFAVQWHLLPVGGRGGLETLVLPAVSLALGPTAIMARTVRATMVDVLREDYVRTARAKGLPERVVLFSHALRNALLPAITLVGLNFGALLGGAVIVEAVFSWPGLGQLLLAALQTRDFPVIQGVTLALGVLFMLANLLVDLSYAVVDPRIRFK